MKKEKRYVVTIDMHVFAENDYMARVAAHDLAEECENNKKVYNVKVLSIDEHPFASLTSRELKDVSRPRNKNEKLPF